MHLWSPVLLLILLGGAFAHNVVRQVNNDFFDITVATNLDQPSGIGFAEDGRIFVLERGGVVKVISTTGAVSVWGDLRSRGIVHNNGILGMALSPAFTQNKQIFLLFPGPQNQQATAGVIVRLTEGANGVADMNSLTYIVGNKKDTTWGGEEGFASCDPSHHTGDLVFGLDGSLFASSGDGAPPNAADESAPADCTAFFGQYQGSRGTLRAQVLDTLAGKVIRIDPNTGNGMTDNPFYNASNPRSYRSQIWTRGHRNPWRMNIRTDIMTAGTGTLYVGDTQDAYAEEINVVRSAEGGKNFGWPCMEGDRINTITANPSRSTFIYPYCQDAIKNSTQGPLVVPMMQWKRTAGEYPIGNCIGGLALYYGSAYTRYAGNENNRTVFFGDYGAGWIKAFWVDANDNFIASQGIVDVLDGLGPVSGLRIDPYTNDLYYLNLGETGPGQVHRLVSTANPTYGPTASITSNVTDGMAPMGVRFTADGSADPRNSPLTFLWDFGDGTPTSTEANPVHQFSASGQFSVTLTVSNLKGQNGSTSTVINTNNLPPTVIITSPADQFEFNCANPTATVFQATVSDDKSPAPKLRWEVRLIHNNHYHPDQYVDVGTDTIAVNLCSLQPEGDTRLSFEVYLVATDSDKAKTTAMVRTREHGQTNSPPVAVMSLSAVSGSPPLSIKAAATRSTDADSDLLTFTWIWGDGNVNHGVSASHTFDHAGSYNVTLIVEDVYGAKSVTSQVVSVAVCGDGIVQVGEDCDDGNLDNTDWCTTKCKNATCGDGFVSPIEPCDDGNQDNSDNCTTLCTLPICGDGWKQAGEACDDGNRNDTDNCTNECLYPGGGYTLCSADWQCPGNDTNKFFCNSFGACQCRYGFARPSCACIDGGAIYWEGPQGSQQPYCLHYPECSQDWQCTGAPNGVNPKCMKTMPSDVIGRCPNYMSTSTSLPKTSSSTTTSSTRSVSASGSKTVSVTASASASVSASASKSESASVTQSVSQSETAIETGSDGETRTVTVSASATVSRSVSQSKSVSASVSKSVSKSSSRQTTSTTSDAVISQTRNSFFDDTVELNSAITFSFEIIAILIIAMLFM